MTLSVEHKKLVERFFPQLLIVGFQGTETVLLEGAETLAGTIAFDREGESWIQGKQEQPKNILSPEQVVDLNRTQANLNPSAYRCVDCEGGGVMQAETRAGINRLTPRHGFPGTLPARAIGELIENNQIEKARVETHHIVTLISNAGFNVTFAPVVDVNVLPRQLSPAIGLLQRSFSSDETVVLQAAELFLEAAEETNIQCALKHFPGHGNAQGDTHKGCVDITDTWNKNKELLPYKQLSQRAGMVMTAHVIHRGIDIEPATVSSRWLQGILRQELGFDGVIVSDDLQMEGMRAYIREKYALNGELKKEKKERLILKHTLKDTLAAGVNLLLFGNQLQAYRPRLVQEATALVVELLEEGALSFAQLRDAFRRVIRQKTRRGLVSHELESLRQALETC